MDMDELPLWQKKVQGFCQQHKLGGTLTVRVLDLVTEIGEVAKEVLQKTCYGKRAFVADQEWAGELGDVLFSLAVVANSTGVDLEKALVGALNKYTCRIAKKGEPGSGK